MKVLHQDEFATCSARQVLLAKMCVLLATICSQFFVQCSKRFVCLQYIIGCSLTWSLTSDTRSIKVALPRYFIGVCKLSIPTEIDNTNVINFPEIENTNVINFPDQAWSRMGSIALRATTVASFLEQLQKQLEGKASTTQQAIPQNWLNQRGLRSQTFFAHRVLHCNARVVLQEQ